MSVHNNSNSSQPTTFLVLPDLNGFTPQRNTPPNVPSTPPRRSALSLPSTPPKRLANFETMSDRSVSSSQTSANPQPSVQSTAVSASNLVRSLLSSSTASSQTSANTQTTSTQSLVNRLSESTSTQNCREETLPTSPNKRQRTGGSVFSFRSPQPDPLPFNSPRSSFQNLSETFDLGSPANSYSSVGSTPANNPNSPNLGFSPLASFSLRSPSAVKRSAEAAFGSPGLSTSQTQSTPATPQTTKKNGFSLFGNVLSPLSLQNSTGAATTPSYVDAPFIKNAELKKREITSAIREKKDFSIQIQGQDVQIDGTSVKSLGEGHYSTVYYCKSKGPQPKELVIRFFQDQKDYAVERERRKRPQMHPRCVLKYLGNQFARYTKIQANKLLAQHHAKFFTFDDLIEQAHSDNSLLEEVRSLLKEEEGSPKRIAFAMKHLTNGYIVAEYAGSIPKQRDDLEQINVLRTIYQELAIPFDPHAENWSSDLKMVDIFEDEAEDGESLHVEKSLKKLAGNPARYEQCFAKPADLTKEQLEKTNWGLKLFGEESTSSSAAAARLAE